MPNAPLLPAAVREDIARQIGERLPTSREFAAPGAPPPTLGESLPVVLLPLDGIRADGPLDQHVVPTGQWHHQIFQGDTATKFARSTDEDNGEQTVREVVTSELATALEHSIGDADQKAPADAEASLLAVPAYQLTAIMLKESHHLQVMVVDRPDRLETIEINTVYEADQFLALLREYPPTDGVPDARR